MNQEKTGKFIQTLRKEKGLTQDELGKILYTSRENISKWERGVSFPNPESLITLSNYFSVSVNEILLGERATSANQQDFDSLSLNILKERDKNKRLLKFLKVEILVILLIFLSYYFVMNYKSIYVYRITGQSANASISEGLSIVSRKKSYLKLGQIISQEPYQEYEVYYYDSKGNKHLIYTETDDNYTLISLKNDKLLPFKDRDKIINNTYVKVNYEGGSELIKLEFQEDYLNNLAFFD